MFVEPLWDGTVRWQSMEESPEYRMRLRLGERWALSLRIGEQGVWSVGFEDALDVRKVLMAALGGRRLVMGVKSMGDPRGLILWPGEGGSVFTVSYTPLAEAVLVPDEVLQYLLKEWVKWSG